MALLAAALGLAGIGVWPDRFYALVWVAPLLMLVALRALRRQSHPLQDLAAHRLDRPRSRPRWRPSSAGCSGRCGTTTAWRSWTYSIPFVHRFAIFEMPLLGYAGYLPFGLECTAVAALVQDLVQGKNTGRA